MKRTRHILWALIRVATALGLLAYLGLSGVIHWSALAGLLVAWPLTLAACLLMVADVALTAWRLCRLMRPRGLHLSLFAATQLTFIGNFFNLCLPGATGGDAVRIYYATRENRGRRMEVATVLLLDRFVGMFALLLWPVLAAPLFWDRLWTSPVLSSLLLMAAVMAMAMVGTILASFSTTLRRHRLLALILRMPALGRHLESMVDTVHTYRHSPRALVEATGIALLGHTLAISVMLLLAQAVVPTGAAWTMSLLIPLGFLANTVPLTPGGLGVGEAAFGRLFALCGLSGGAETLLSWRLVLLLTGLVGLAFYTLRGQE